MTRENRQSFVTLGLRLSGGLLLMCLLAMPRIAAAQATATTTCPSGQILTSSVTSTAQGTSTLNYSCVNAPSVSIPTCSPGQLLTNSVTTKNGTPSMTFSCVTPPASPTVPSCSAGQILSDNYSPSSGSMSFYCMDSSNTQGNYQDPTGSGIASNNAQLSTDSMDLATAVSDADADTNAIRNCRGKNCEYNVRSPVNSNATAWNDLTAQNKQIATLESDLKNLTSSQPYNSQLTQDESALNTANAQATADENAISESGSRAMSPNNSHVTAESDLKTRNADIATLKGEITALENAGQF